MDNTIRPLINNRSDAHAIKEAGISRGMKSLRVDGLDKVLKGVTTLEEVLRVTSASDNGTV